MGVRGKAAGAKTKKRQVGPKLATQDGEQVEGNGAAEDQAQTGHNEPPIVLSEDQQQALFWQHVREYEQALAVKKDAEARFKNACKRIKAEGGSDQIAAIKDAIKLDTPEGEAEIRADIERKQRVAKWMATALGTQLTMFEDRTPAVDRAYAEGKRDGFKGQPRTTGAYDASTPQAQEYMRGWSDGQRTLMEGGYRPLPPAEPIEPATETNEEEAEAAREAFEETDDGPHPHEADQIGSKPPTHVVN